MTAPFSIDNIHVYMYIKLLFIYLYKCLVSTVDNTRGMFGVGRVVRWIGLWCSDFMRYAVDIQKSFTLL
jgi:hypothetical protein